MDQDAFRKLLSSSKQNGSQSTSSAKRSLLPNKAKDAPKKSTESSKAAFKPRKLKGSNYRDRATERRTGVAGDFAEVESVLENFEKQHANEDKEAVEEQRRYLGGDSEHTVLVKGLDFALLEQTKARMTASTSVQDDEELEEAFRGAVSASPPAPELIQTTSKKRTREEILRELKSKRAKGDTQESVPKVRPEEVKALEKAKRDGKFKPIGFKPVGSAKSKDVKEVKKKKKRQVATGAPASSGPAVQPPVEEREKDGSNGQNTEQASEKAPSLANVVPELEPEPLGGDFDIFAGAGEYEGFDDDDDDDDDEDEDEDEDELDSPKRDNLPAESGKSVEPTKEADEVTEPRPRRKWIDDDEPPSPPPERFLPSKAKGIAKGKERETETPASPEVELPVEDDREDDTRPEPISRLAPLASSTIPSIRDILEADSALEAEKKRKARKEKRKGKGGEGEGGEGKKASAEAKLNRDYQKLKSFTEKKSKS